MKNTYIILAVMVMLVVSCKPKNKPEQSSEALRAELSADIDKTEKELYVSKNFDTQKAKQMIGKYVNYSRKFPNDTTSAKYLIKASEIALSLNQPHNAVEYLTTVEKSGMQCNDYPLAIFYLGYTYHNYLNDTAKARHYYELFIQKYPDHSLSDDAEASIKFLGLSDEELIDAFEKMNK
ncbi:MAG: tetratricopeptide repeat protein [Bacteroidales bacterium]|nr:tetratricopeptide repeat protein [Bacteroidales bacterium]HOY37896.1 tetratricopeptide repeat protein [Bacteroidales bacterium]HQP03853.1 tetratricopeptide repeat protein [Bacteroidales bacterium]